MDGHLSTVSNRLNAVMKQLTNIATIFPAAQLADRLLRPELRLRGPPDRRWQAFLGYGIGLEAIGFFMLLAYFKRQRWF